MQGRVHYVSKMIEESKLIRYPDEEYVSIFISEEGVYKGDVIVFSVRSIGVMIVELDRL